MFEKRPPNFNQWYDLCVNGKLLVSIRGRETAEWFLKSMSYGNDTDKFTLSLKEDFEEIKAAEPW